MMAAAMAVTTIPTHWARHPDSQPPASISPIASRPPSGPHHAAKQWHSSIYLVPHEDGPMLHRLLQSRRRDERKKGLLAHLNRDRVTPVLAGLPAVRFWRWSWFWLWLVLLCHAFNKACGETGRPSIVGSGGLPQGHLRPPLRLTTCHPSCLGLLL